MGVTKEGVVNLTWGNQGGLLKKGMLTGNVERGLAQARRKAYPTEGRALTDRAEMACGIQAPGSVRRPVDEIREMGHKG